MGLVSQTLTRKRAEIIGAIAKHQACIAQAKHDLSHVSATTKILESSDARERSYIVSPGFFAKGEIAGCASATSRAARSTRASWRRG